jgi:hypothetical protein
MVPYCSVHALVLPCDAVLSCVVPCLVFCYLVLSCVTLSLSCVILSRVISCVVLSLSIYNSCCTFCDIRVNARMGMRLHATNRKKEDIYVKGRLAGRTRPRRKKVMQHFSTNESNRRWRPNKGSKERARKQG